MHVREPGTQAASDEHILVSADTDFGTLRAVRKQAAPPSVIPFRHGSQHRPANQAVLLKANLPQLAASPEAGSIVVVAPNHIRIRTLPLIP